MWSGDIVDWVSLWSFVSLVQSFLLYRLETWTLKQGDEKHVQAFDMKAQRRILQINWYDFITSDSIREQTKLVDLPLFITDMPFCATSSVFLKKHRPIPCYSTLSTSQRKSPYSRLEASTRSRPRKTWLQQVVVDQDCDTDAISSQAHDVTCRSLRLSLVRCSSEWVTELTANLYCI